MTDINRPALREMLAIRAMGWAEITDNLGNQFYVTDIELDCYGQKEVLRIFKPDWLPDKPETGQVWMLVEKMRKKEWRVLIIPGYIGYSTKAVPMHQELDKVTWGVAGWEIHTNPTTAICLAIAKAMEGK